MQYDLHSAVGEYGGELLYLREKEATGIWLSNEK